MSLRAQALPTAHKAGCATLAGSPRRGPYRHFPGSALRIDAGTTQTTVEAGISFIMGCSDVFRNQRLIRRIQQMVSRHSCGNRRRRTNPHHSAKVRALPPQLSPDRRDASYPKGYETSRRRDAGDSGGTLVFAESLAVSEVLRTTSVFELV